MERQIKVRSHLSQIVVFAVMQVIFRQSAIAEAVTLNQTGEILVKRLSNLTLDGETIPKIVKLSTKGQQEVEESLLTLKSDPVKVHSGFEAVDINVRNRPKGEEDAKKIAMIQEDIQSSIKIQEPTLAEPVKEIIQSEATDSEDTVKKRVRVKEDIESRLFADDESTQLDKGTHNDDKYHYETKRSESDYFVQEPILASSSQKSTTSLPLQEEDSFFSIFESLFGSNDEESQTKKKSNPEDETMFNDDEEEGIKENIKIVGDILKPTRPVQDHDIKSKNAHLTYETEVPEYRIVNNLHASQSQKQEYRPSENKHTYHSSYVPNTERPYQSYKPYITTGYEDYDLDEFLNKRPTTTRVKYVPPITTSVRYNPTRTTTSPSPPPTTIRTTGETTIKNNSDSKVKFPSIQKKNDYIHRNRYQETTEKGLEKKTERTTYQKPEIKTTFHQKSEIQTTTNPQYSIKSQNSGHHETKMNEVKPQKLQESPNFYNLINLPVKYSTKDTAIPLISTSYANTKIQGMGAQKYEKGGNGKYPNHKYDQTTITTTKRPNYWATKRTESTTTSTEKPTTTYELSTTAGVSIKYTSTKGFEKIDYDSVQMGLGPVFGGYGSKTGSEAHTHTQTTKPVTTTTSVYRTTVQRNENLVKNKTKIENLGINTKVEQPQTKVKEILEDIPAGDYEYDIMPAKVEELKPNNQNNFLETTYAKGGQLKNEVQYNKGEGDNYGETFISGADSEVPEYEYYDYDFELSTLNPTTTTLSPKIKIKYPNLSKEKIEEQSSNEKLTVVIPSKDQETYVENHSLEHKLTTSFKPFSVTKYVFPTTTLKSKLITTPNPKEVTAIAVNPTIPDRSTMFKKATSEIYKSSLSSKEPAPVFEKQEELNGYNTPYTPSFTATKKIIEKQTLKPAVKMTTTESSVKPIVVTPMSIQKQNELDDNINIVVVPIKQTTKKSEKGDENLNVSSFSTATVTSPIKPIKNSSATQFSNYAGFTTEFTVGSVHGQGESNVYQVQVKGSKPNLQGHFVASSIATNPYEEDEPFRPIPNPSGITTSFQVVHENNPGQNKPANNPLLNQNQRPSTPPKAESKREPNHEAHKFIPSPQFHRPAEQHPLGNVRPIDVDYDLEGIQTEPKPGEYVIFSKPQLNPEVNDKQKRKPEENNLKGTVPNSSQFHDKGNRFSQEIQDHVIFNPKEGQFYQSSAMQKPLVPEKIDVGRPNIYGTLPNSNLGEGELSLQLVPPRDMHTEKPFDRNFISPEVATRESTGNYPRPHWEKNGKPSFLLNQGLNKNDLIRPPSMPSQVAPTLIPPNNASPQRLRRPIQSSNRKIFNEASSNIKPKPNLPNILPQFRPNMKIGSGPYYRPPAYGNPNRRNGVNRYQNKEHGNFPYHIQYPDKESFMNREYETPSEIVPKFITNRGKVPSELWSNHGMQKRFGHGPVNSQSMLDQTSHPPQGPTVLKRPQRTPVTTLQMLKHIPGVNDQRIQILRENDSDASASFISEVRRTYPNQHKTGENLYIVYPAKAPQKLQPDNSNVFIVSDSKSHNKMYNSTTIKDKKPLLNLNKRLNQIDEASKNNFPYGFVKSDEGEGQEVSEEYKEVTESDINGKENLDMNLHLRKNQWNEMRNSQLSKKVPSENFHNDFYRFSEQTSENSKNIQVNPPSEYHTSITGDMESTFTLGTVLRTVPDSNPMGEIVPVPLRNDQNKEILPQLSINERISNGKIITMSLPLDVKDDVKEEKDTAKKTQSFQAPFQASSSVDMNQGWTAVKAPQDKVTVEENEGTTEESTTRFSFENFKPELIGGFRPLYEIPEEHQETKKSHDKSEREKKTFVIR